MKESLEQANIELRRTDHLIYVSLKYTRTVDIIKSIIERLINSFDHCIIALLKYRGHEDIPKSPGMRTNILDELYKEKEIVEFIEFYRLLRQLSRAEFTRSQEFRRHVTMTAMLASGPLEINIDIITEYYHRAIVYVRFVKKIVESKEKDFAKLLESAVIEVDFEKR